MKTSPAEGFYAIQEMAQSRFGSLNVGQTDVIEKSKSRDLNSTFKSLKGDYPADKLITQNICLEQRSVLS